MIGYASGKKYRRLGIVAAKMGKKILAPLQYNATNAKKSKLQEKPGNKVRRHKKIDTAR